MTLSDSSYLGGRYQILDLIGVGGMAEVYYAHDVTLDRAVAIKVLLPRFARDESFAVRFKNEARAAARLTDSHIVDIFDWGQAGELCYIVMEYVQGINLQQAIRQRGAFAPREVANIAMQVCQALDEAHAHDIIHRDIKPANIMLQASGNIKLMDFGVAQKGIAEGGKEAGEIVGTANYMSPEQISGQPVRPQSDLYSLGIAMYEAVTACKPFSGASSEEIFAKQLNSDPIAPNYLNPEIDKDFNHIVAKAMRKELAQRYPSAFAMKSSLSAYLNSPAHEFEPLAYPQGWAVAVVRGPEDLVGEVATFTRSCVVGRSRSSDIRISDSTVSASHVRLTPRGMYLEVEDLGALNGVYVDGRKVRKREVFQAGSNVDIGKVRIRIGRL